MMTIEDAKRTGASAGLLGEGAPRGMGRLPGATQAAFGEAYAKGRHCRRVAEGKERVSSREGPMPQATSRADLAAEFARRADLRAEFSSVESFVAYAQAASAGKVKRVVGCVVS